MGHDRRCYRLFWLLPRWTAGLLVLCLGLLAGCSTGKSPNAPPRIMLMPSALDLGTGAPGEVLTGTVLVRNTGGSPLQFSKIKPGCSCLSVQLSSGTIPTGQSATLTIAGRMKPDGSPLAFGVSLSTNDPAQPESVLFVQASPAPPPIRPEQAEIDFGMVPLGASPQKSVRMLSTSGAAMFASDCQLDLQTPPAAVDAHVRAEESGSGRSFVLVVSPRKGLPLGSFADILRLTFHDANGDHDFTVPIRGVVTRSVIASPSTVYFDDTQGDARVTRIVLIRRPDGHALASIRKMETPPAVQAEEDSLGDTGKTVRRIRLTLDRGGALNHEFQANLRIWIEGEVEPLTIRMTAPQGVVP
jgi:Protein of unknown function (DUF1573)